MSLDQHTERPDPVQPDLTQPARPVRPGVARPARLVPRHGRSSPRKPPSSDRPSVRVTRRVTRRPPRAKRPRRRLWLGCLLPSLALALFACCGGLLTFGPLLFESPTNILILGVDRRPGEGDAVRTDTILLLHAAPRNSRLVMLSIPRDLWVTIPGRGEGRINTAHVYGELEKPGAGPARVAETVSYNLGVPVHHTLRLDFDAFRHVIDAAGGIEIDVPAPIVDDAYPTADYGTMRVEIPAGRQRMDGETALRYARSRHGGSDFERAGRQQQILVALMKKLTSPGGWLKLPRAYQALQSAVETDMGFRDLSSLALTWQLAGGDGLERIVIDSTMTTPFRTAQGSVVLLPNWELIHPLVQAQFKP